MHRPLILSILGRVLALEPDRIVLVDRPHPRPRRHARGDGAVEAAAQHERVRRLAHARQLLGRELLGCLEQGGARFFFIKNKTNRKH